MWRVWHDQGQTKWYGGGGRHLEGGDWIYGDTRQRRGPQGLPVNWSRRWTPIRYMDTCARYRARCWEKPVGLESNPMDRRSPYSLPALRIGTTLLYQNILAQPSTASGPFLSVSSAADRHGSTADRPLPTLALADPRSSTSGGGGGGIGCARDTGVNLDVRDCIVIVWQPCARLASQAIPFPITIPTKRTGLPHRPGVLNNLTISRSYFFFPQGCAGPKTR